MGCANSKAQQTNVEIPDRKEDLDASLLSVQETQLSVQENETEGPSTAGPSTTGPSTAKHVKTPFQQWMEKVKTANAGKKTTLKQEFELALDLYQRAYPNSHQQQASEEVIKMVENTPVKDTNSIVSWTGIKVDWFLNVFCKSPFMKLLVDFGCEVWFIRKICVIEMVRQTASLNSREQPNGTFVENIHSVVRGWDLEGGQDVTAKPTTFISYTGAYTMAHVVKVLANLDPQEYIWMDIFCVNQFAWTGKGRTPEMRHFRDTFMDDLQSQIQSIGNTALILEKWNDVMLTLGQMWVLWEIFNTSQAKVDLKVLLTPEQRDSFIANCVESSSEFDKIRASLATINANDAVTDDDIDRRFILERMKRDDPNLVQVNTVVLENMRAWVAEEGLKSLFLTRKKGKQPSTTALSNMGSLLQEQGRLDEAELLYREALETRRQVIGNQHPSTLNSINNMGSLLYKQGRQHEAEPLYREALENRRQVLGNQHPDTLKSINNMGMLLLAQGRLDEAEPLYKEALETLRQVLGNQHPNTLNSINNMGMLLYKQGRQHEAESLYREALETRRQVLGNRHPDTLASINNMGMLQKAQGKLDEAEPLYREALETLRQVLGSRHPNTLASINNMGSLLEGKGRLDEAEPLYREALKTRRQVLGNRHPDTLASINNMGTLLKAQGKLDEAEPFFREALETLRQVLGGRHPNTLASINNMGSLLEGKGRLDEAEPLYREALETQRQVLGNQHPNTLNSINNMGSLLYKQGRLDEAEPFFREVLETRRQVLGNRHPSTLASIKNMGTLLLAQGRQDEAKPFFREAQKIMLEARKTR